MMVGMELLWFGLGVGLLALLSVGLARWAKVGLGWQPLWVIIRAAIQLAAIAVILHGVLAVGWLVIAFLALMLTTASVTAGGRLTGITHGRRYAAVGVVAGALAGLGPALLLGLSGADSTQVIALGGIVIGNAMRAATLAGRNFQRSAVARRDEVEAWFGLGARPNQAYSDIGTEAVRESLLPTLDQTKSTGLVTLPGAFVGALFGGADPTQAAQFQLVVLASLTLCMLTTAIIVTRLAGRSPYLMLDERDLHLPRTEAPAPQPQP